MRARVFTDLIVWRKGHCLVLDIYKIVASFPKEEIYGLTAQIKRAVVSVTSNISEGFARQTKKEKAQFYYISLGSLTEVQNQLIIARDLDFIKQNDFKRLIAVTIEVSKLMNGLIKSLKS